MGKKRYDDDDGRTIADMSELGIRTPLGYYTPGKHRKTRMDRRNGAEPANGSPWHENETMSREARRGAISGALLASLLIALAFIVGIGIFIALIWLIFRK